mgnify:CR=1 FL=1
MTGYIVYNDNGKVTDVLNRAPNKNYKFKEVSPTLANSIYDMLQSGTKLSIYDINLLERIAINEGRVK